MAIPLARGAVARKVCVCAHTQPGVFVGGLRRGVDAIALPLSQKRVGDRWMTQSVPDGGSLVDDPAIPLAGDPTCAWVTSG